MPDHAAQPKLNTDDEDIGEGDIGNPPQSITRTVLKKDRNSKLQYNGGSGHTIVAVGLLHTVTRGERGKEVHTLSQCSSMSSSGFASEANMK